MKVTPRFFPSVFILPAGALLLASLLAGCGRNDGQPAGPPGLPPLPVVADEVHPQTIDIHATYAGRIRGMREVEVRARVSGILEERLYQEGQVVEQGEALFRLERDPYAIALQQAEADLAHAEASAQQAEREWRRISSLFAQAAVSEREHDRALSELETGRARLKLAHARVAEARLNLDYTTVVAPIAGPTGMESLSEGSLVERGTLLTTIVQHDPVQVRFALPEGDAAQLRAGRRAPPERDAHHGHPIRLWFPDGTEYGRTGTVDFTDSSVDPRTGSVQARALFDNPEGELIPGQFVRVRMTLRTVDNAFAVDPAAVTEGQSGPSVFLVMSDNTVQARNVRLGPMVDGRQVILEGLEPGDRLVVSGLVMLQPGMPVAPINPTNGSN